MTLTELQQAILSIYPTAVYPSTYTVAVDTSGNATIALWNNSIGVQPTATQLADALAVLEVKPAQTAQLATLLASYNAQRYGAPVPIVSGTTTWSFPTDTLTQTNVMGYLVAFNAATTPAGGLPLQDVNGTVQMLTYAEMQALALAIGTQSIAAWQKLKTLEAEVMAATTVAAVQAIVW